MTKARILSAISNKHSARTSELTEALDLSSATVIRHCRALQKDGFIFCEDDYEGRQRKGGKYAAALWCMNCETSGISVEQAKAAMKIAKAQGANGRDVLCDMDLAC